MLLNTVYIFSTYFNNAVHLDLETRFSGYSSQLFKKIQL